MKRIGTFIVVVFLSLAAGARAEFTMPMVDFEIPTTGTASSFAIWASSTVSEAAGTTLSVTFPSDMPLPAVNFNFGTCFCVFMKMSTTTGTFSPHEVTVLAGSVVSASYVSLSLPADMGAGLFYIRFHSTAQIYTPPKSGWETLVLSDRNSKAVESKGFKFQFTNIADSVQVNLTGTVKEKTVSGVTGAAVPGALVFVTTTAGISDADFIKFNMGPRVTPTAKAITSQMIMGVTDSEGKYSIQVPPYTAALGSITYYVYASFSIFNGATIDTYRTPTTPQLIDATSLPTININLTAPTTPICTNSGC